MNSTNRRVTVIREADAMNADINAVLQDAYANATHNGDAGRADELLTAIRALDNLLRAAERVTQRTADGHFVATDARDLEQLSAAIAAAKGEC